MRRLQTRLMLLTVGGVVGTVLLMVGFQVAFDTHVYRQLDAGFRQRIQNALEAEGLTPEAREARLQQVLLEYMQTDEGFRDVIDNLGRAISASRRATVIAGLIALGFGLLAGAFTSRYIAAPLLDVSRAAREIRRGNLGARVRLHGGLANSSELSGLGRDFNMMAEEIERLEKERKSLVADIAHELRTPLTVLQGQLDAMQYGVLPCDGEQLSKASRQAELLSRLVKDLRLLSLAESARLSLDLRKVDLNTTLEDIVESFRDQARTRDVTLELHKAPVPELEIDQDRMAQVAINLLGNALRHTPLGGTVDVSVFTEGDCVGFKVGDSGQGLSQEMLSAVFDRFYRTDAGRSRDSGGSGLGLAIVKAIVELHGGAVAAGNGPRGGAEFTVSLPIERTAPGRQSL